MRKDYLFCRGVAQTCRCSSGLMERILRECGLEDRARRVRWSPSSCSERLCPFLVALRDPWRPRARRESPCRRRRQGPSMPQQMPRSRSRTPRRLFIRMALASATKSDFSFAKRVDAAVPPCSGLPSTVLTDRTRRARAVGGIRCACRPAEYSTPFTLMRGSIGWLTARREVADP